MPLRDHFRSPVNDSHSWDELHGGWPGEMVRDLRNILPAGYRAGPIVHLGSRFEPDADGPEAGPGAGGTATLTTLAPTLTVEAELFEQDEYEVRLYDTERGRTLVAVIEIVSPSNKDRPATRETFVGKLTTLLQQGLCVSVVDLVSVRQANLYAQLLALMGRADPSLGEAPPHLYAVTLRGRQQPKRRPALLDAWYYPMAVGQPLPTIPIWLAPGLGVLLQLETSYQEACRVLGIA